jgi:cell division protease FtsH
LLPLGLLITVVLLLLSGILSTGPRAQSLSYSDFLTKVDSGQVTSVTINDKGAVDGTLRSGQKFVSQIPTALNSNQLDQRLQSNGVKITGTTSGSSWWPILLSWVPLVLLLVFFLWTGRAAQRSLAGGIGGFGRSRARIIEAERPATRFADVAGYEGVKQEISEIIDFLRAPGRYAAAGAKGPRGVIMVGPPGTGKTLLARAVAGEASVAFLSVTGSAFVEMFVGVGASRVRDRFREAPRTRAVDHLHRRDRRYRRSPRWAGDRWPRGA